MTRRAYLNRQVISPGDRDRQERAMADNYCLSILFKEMAESACPAHVSESDQYCECHAMVTRWRTTCQRDINAVLGLYEVPPSASEEAEDDLRYQSDEELHSS